VSLLGEDDAITTHAQLLVEKRIGFFILTFGIFSIWQASC
jgi:hypothetical protein